MVKEWALGLITWIAVQPSCSWLSAGVTMSSDFRVNDGFASVMLFDVSKTVVAIIGTISRWMGLTTIFCVTSSSNAPHLTLPCLDWSCSYWSGILTRFYFKSSLTEHFLKNNIPMRMLPIVGSTMNWSSKLRPARNYRNRTC